MDPQLLKKIRQRQKAQGMQPQQDKAKVQAKKPSPPKHNSEFDERKKKLQAFFNQQSGGGTSSAESPPPPKQQIKGNQDNFSNARALLQGKLNQPSGGSSSKTSNVTTLPLPPPPPPPTNNLPKLNVNNLPPPPPPPSLNNLSPPPNLNAVLGNKSSTSKMSSPPPPPPPPPPVKNVVPPPPPPPPVQTNKSTIPPPPPPPPVQTNKSTIPPPPPPPVQTNKTTPPPPPPPPIQNQSNVNPPNPYVEKTTTPPPPVNNQAFTVSRGQQKSERREARKSGSTRSPIFSSQKAPNISAQFFGKDVAAYVKKQFIRQTDILEVIGTRVTKKTYNFNFPSIEHNLRDIEPIQTLYADSATLDVVSCYMQKNMNAIKPHNDARDTFKGSYQNYNWNSDPMKLKPIKDLAHNIPSVSFKEPNFVQIKNGLNRCDNLIKSFLKYQNYNACAEVKKLREEADKLITTYCKNPQGNQALYDQIQRKLQQIKETKM